MSNRSPKRGHREQWIILELYFSVYRELSRSAETFIRICEFSQKARTEERPPAIQAPG